MSVKQVQASLGSNPPEAHLRSDHDFYRTGAIAVRRLLAVESFPGCVWEPACGQGDISDVLSQAGLDVLSSDLIDRDYGTGGMREHDFLEAPPFDCAHIITNPPFNLAEEFAHRALSIVPEGGKVAFLCRLAWMEGQRRHKRLFALQPPRRVLVFPDRIPLARGDGPMQTGLIAFAWFVWERGFTGTTELTWI